MQAPLISKTRYFVAMIALLVFTGCGGEPEKTPESPSPTKSNRNPRKSPIVVARKSQTDIRKSTRPPLFGGPDVVKTDDPPTPKKKRPVKPPTVHRHDDNRPKHDDDALKKLGIAKYESKRLRLYTDIDAGIAKTLPPLIDQAFEAWQSYFGKLPPARDGAPFQITGYVIRDKTRFQRAGVIPGDLPKIVNGRHRGYEFWMHDPPPEWPYYRRHLLIHEATHCFMYAVRDLRFATWYMEGMAEFFGTHRIGKDGKVAFGVIPDDPKQFVGSGRMEYIRKDCESSGPLSIQKVVAYKPTDYLKNQPYAWSWALCKFLDSHPKYGKPFREMGRIQTASTFNEAMRKLVDRNLPWIHSEWYLFAVGFDYGYDVKRAAIDIQPGKELPAGDKPVSAKVAADRGWQSSGVWVDQGEVVEITATGRFVLAKQPKPWISEPQGVSFTWYNGRPLGELQAVLVPDSKKSLPVSVKVLPTGPVGTRRVFRAETKGTIYLRINDHLGRLSDNTGHVTARIRRSPSGK